MKIAVFGSGYVGLVTGGCFAEAGNQVVCVDVDEAKVVSLQAGNVPIFEPGLEAVLTRNIQSQHITFTTDAKQAIEFSDVIFITVGTPSDEDGSADLSYVLAVAHSIGENMNGYKVIVDKSTVPVGTADKVQLVINGVLKRRHENIEFDVISNPEFLKEGAALDDFNKPDRVIIGTDVARAETILRELYAPFNRNSDRIIVMDIRSAELTKYAANAMLATKISFMNEIANIAEKVGADIEEVRRGIGSDPRIGYRFIYPGAGYGGSCFPKDVQALRQTALENDVPANILEAVEKVNQRQKTTLFIKLSQALNGEIKGKNIAVWGLSFKSNTNDMRDAPSRVLLQSLWNAGAIVTAYDPEAREEAIRIFGEREDMTLVENSYVALENADALVICTEWKVFRSPDFEKLKRILNNPVIIDGRNLYEPKKMAELGFEYYGVGRGLSVQAG